MSLEAANAITPNDFEVGEPRHFAQLVAAGRVEAALAASRQLPAGVNTVGRNGTSAIEFAIHRDDPVMLDALLKAGAKPNGTPGRSPLYLAVDGDDLNLVRTLLQAGADPNDDWNGDYPLFEAALYGKDEAVLMLLKAGTRIDQRDSIGGAAITSASAADKWRTVLLLLDHGASIWPAISNGGTLALDASQSRLLPNNPDGKAKLVVIERLKALGSPWPPPSAVEVKRLVAEGWWPPAGARK